MFTIFIVHIVKHQQKKKKNKENLVSVTLPTQSASLTYQNLESSINEKKKTVTEWIFELPLKKTPERDGWFIKKNSMNINI